MTADVFAAVDAVDGGDLAEERDPLGHHAAADETVHGRAEEIEALPCLEATKKAELANRMSRARRHRGALTHDVLVHEPARRQLPAVSFHPANHVAAGRPQHVGHGDALALEEVQLDVIDAV